MDYWSPNELPSAKTLESLSWTCIDEGYEYFSEPVAIQIAALTSLTNLELCQTRLFSYVRQLGSLPQLQRLVLEECATLGQHLLQPGAFTSLQELHIQNDYDTDSKGYPDLQEFLRRDTPDLVPPELRDLEVFENFENPDKIIEEEELEELRVLMKAKAVECMSGVLQLPRIRKLSGDGTLLELGLPEELSGWTVSEELRFRVWTKC